jgi:subtilisin family serine protease
MSANQRNRAVLLCLLLAAASLLGIFAIISASSANASQGKVPPAAINSQPAVIITPTELHATLYPGELLTQTLWITNTSDSPITFTIYEMTSPVRLGGFNLEPVAIPVIDPEAQAQVAAQTKAMVIISLRQVPDLSAAYFIHDKAKRTQYVYDRLLETALRSQALFDWLVSQGTHPQRLLTTNAIAATLDGSQLAKVAENSLVRQILPNRQAAIIPSSPNPLVQPLLPARPSVQPDAVPWNISQIRADDAWNTFGIRGEGAVVATIDTGVMYDHAALVNSYRGNNGDGTFDHNYNWFDFVAGSDTPYDDNGHGSMLTGIMTGDDGADHQIGVAPEADWIAVKACSGGGACTDVGLHAALQWMVAPTDLSGNNPDPAKAPDIVLGGWGGQGCDGTFEFDLMVLRAAGILPVFSPGGSGPACNSIGSPGDLPDALAAGATDQSDTIALFSSRGPSCYAEIKPDLSAPGMDILSSLNDGSYTIWSGTSLSAAHAAGTAALVISADPSLGPDAVEQLLNTTSLCREDLACGGDTCPGANNVYGHGRIDAYTAVYSALGNPPQVDLPWLSEAPISGTIPAGEGISIEITFNATGLDPDTYTGTLGIFSNDPDQPFSAVPVTLEVLSPATPVIGIDPRSFSATLPVGGLQTDTLTITNEGDAVLTFTLYEISATRRLLSPPADFSIPDPYPAGSPVQVDPTVRTQLLFLGRSRLILYLRGQMDFSVAASITGRAARGQYVYDQLLTLAAQSSSLYNWLLLQSADPHRLLTTNSIAATLDVAQLETVLSFPQVARVGINRYNETIQDVPATMNWMVSQMNLPDTVEWNIAKIRADETWSTFGITGVGATVGIIDTGVMYTHPALVNQYRGNLGGGNYDHNYNWYDLIHGQPDPYDDNGHGTFGAGIAVGDNGGINQIGVAPGAKWIGVKALDGGGGGTLEDLHAALQWMLAPSDLNGDNPDPAKAPQVVLNMWRWLGCDNSFDQDLVALRAANILPIFAPGSDGPGCGLVAYPAANPDTLSAGSTDINDVISGFSARGPSCYDGSIKPDVVAPGVEIRSSTTDGDYQVWSGTSFSTAHLAGAAALLFSADPQLGLDQLEQTLFDTAVCLDADLYCGGDTCPGANNTYGHGRIDVFEAVSATIGTSYDIPWLIAGPLTLDVQPGDSVDVDVIFNAAGMQPGTYYGGIAIESNDPLAPFTTLPITLTVTPPCQPANVQLVGFTPSHPQVGEVITFTAVATGTLPINYTWDFDDGSIAIGDQVTHVFDSDGLHVVWLTAENACGTYPVEIDLFVEAALKRILLPLVGR